MNASPARPSHFAVAVDLWEPPLLLQGGNKFLVSQRELVFSPLFFIELWVLYLVLKKKFLLSGVL